MTEFTVKEFRKEFQFQPSMSFNVSKHITPEHMAEALDKLPEHVLWAEYGICKDKEERKAHYMLEVSWFINHHDHLQGEIEKVILFDEYIEMMLHMRAQNLKCNHKIVELN